MIKGLEHQLFGDLETTPLVNFRREGRVRCYMWQINNHKNQLVKRGQDIESLIEFLCNYEDRFPVVWFHNSKFDMSYVRDYLLRSGFVFVNKQRFKLLNGECTGLIDAMNVEYNFSFKLNDHFITCVDSAKVYAGLSINDIGSIVGIKKLTEQYDYDKYVPLDYEPTESEWGYLNNDVRILCKAMLAAFKNYNTIKYTRPAYAFGELQDFWNKKAANEEYIDGIKCEKFNKMFPATSLEEYEKIKDFYRGGAVLTNERYRGKETGTGDSHDNNGMYSAAQEMMLPYGKGHVFEGSYDDLDEDIKKKYPMYMQMLHCDFKIKDMDHVPTLMKGLAIDNGLIYSNADMGGSRRLPLCMKDLKHFRHNYNYWNVKYDYCVAYKGINKPFHEFIMMHAKAKAECGRIGDKIGKSQHKFSLNMSYGKFAENPYRSTKEFYYDEREDIVRSVNGEVKGKPRNMYAMGCFITSNARDILYNMIYSIGWKWVHYCDTDSVKHDYRHQPVANENVKFDQFELGAWKKEYRYYRGKFLRDKTYAVLEMHDDHPEIKAKDKFTYEKGHEGDLRYAYGPQFEKGEMKYSYDFKLKCWLLLNVKGAGMTKEAKKNVTCLDDYRFNVPYPGALKARLVKGGTLLIPTSTTLKDFDRYSPNRNII